jgi:hypothetical protein
LENSLDDFFLSFAVSRQKMALKRTSHQCRT